MMYLMKVTWWMLAVLFGWLTLIAIAGGAKASPNCPSLEDASADINFTAAYLGEGQWEITNDNGNIFYVWENKTFCLFTMEASIGESPHAVAGFLNQWNTKSNLLKAADNGEMILVGGYTVLPDATPSLLAVNLLMFDAQVQRFVKAFFEKFDETGPPRTHGPGDILRDQRLSGLAL